MEVQKEPVEVTVKKLEVTWAMVKSSGTPPSMILKLFAETYAAVSQVIREDQELQGERER